MSESPAVLVTGGAGYVGSHACKALHAAGYLPVTYDNLSVGHAWAVRWGPLETGDLRDGDRLRAAIRQHRPVAVLHFAAHAYVGESVVEPAKYYANNVGGTLALLDAMREGGVGRIVFSSTCAVYGRPRRMPITEDMPCRPANPYGRSKLMVETILRDVDAAYGLRHVALRYFNAAGADPDGEIGERHEPETHLIPLALAAAAGDREQPLAIFGTDYPTPDGTAVRDYVHVADLARAHVLALESLLGGAPSAAYNLGNGQGYSVRQVVDAAAAVTGRPIPVRHGPRRPGDPPVLIGDAARIRSALGWAPRHGDLDTIIATAWNWYRRGATAPA